MSLLQKIKDDQVAARKDGNKWLSKTLTTLLAEASVPGFNDGKRESTDAEVIAVCQKFIKNICETLKQLDSGCDEARALVAERLVIESYRPTQLTVNEMVAIVDNIHRIEVAAGGSPNIGTTMKFFKINYEGQFDGTVLSGIIREALK